MTCWGGGGAGGGRLLDERGSRDIRDIVYNNYYCYNYCTHAAYIIVHYRYMSAHGRRRVRVVWPWDDASSRPEAHSVVGGAGRYVTVVARWKGRLRVSWRHDSRRVVVGQRRARAAEAFTIYYNNIQTSKYDITRDEQESYYYINYWRLGVICCCDIGIFGLREIEWKTSLEENTDLYLTRRIETFLNKYQKRRVSRYFHYIIGSCGGSLFLASFGSLQWSRSTSTINNAPNEFLFRMIFL